MVMRSQLQAIKDNMPINIQTIINADNIDNGTINESFTAQTSVTVTHNFGAYPQVNVIDDANIIIIPLSITHDSVNAVTITFSIATSGIIIVTAGNLANQGDAIANATNTTDIITQFNTLLNFLRTRGDIAV